MDDKLVLSRMEGLNKIALLYQMMFYGISSVKDIRTTNEKLIAMLVESYDPDFKKVPEKYVVAFCEDFLKNQLKIAGVISKSIDENWDLTRLNLVDQAIISYAILSVMKVKPELQERRSKVIINDTMDLAKVFTVEKNLPFIQKTLNNALIEIAK